MEFSILDTAFREASERAIAEWGCQETNWKPVSDEKAKEIARHHTIKELCEMTGCKTSVLAAASAIIELTEGEQFYPNTMAADLIQVARTRVHREWKLANQAKFSDPKREDRMYQFLPAKYLPLDEVKKNDIFIRDIFELITGLQWEGQVQKADERHQKYWDENISRVNTDLVNIMLDDEWDEDHLSDVFRIIESDQSVREKMLASVNSKMSGIK